MIIMACLGVWFLCRYNAPSTITTCPYLHQSNGHAHYKQQQMCPLQVNSDVRLGQIVDL